VEYTTKKMFVVSAEKRFFMPVLKTDALFCDTKNQPFIVSVAMDQHQKTHLWCRLLRRTDTKKCFSKEIKNDHTQI
jgi:hypothetical protein